LVLCSLVFISATTEDDLIFVEFLGFVKKYDKHYDSWEEFEKRMAIFKENKAIATELDKRDPTATYGVTIFSDLSVAEFRAHYLMPNLTHSLSQPQENYELSSPSVEVPASFDWRERGMVTPVYNQEQCGSCWAFSATENIESMWAIAGHGLHSLSMQQVVDCDRQSYGCGGGWPYTAYTYMIQFGGLEAYGSYPYVAHNEACHAQRAATIAHIHSWHYITRVDNVEAMLDFTFTKGPPSVCVDASSWQFYHGGVISSCGQSLDHCVQITGFSTVGGVPAWHVRNSWGTSWGLSGYLFVRRGGDVCGIGRDVSAAIV